MGLFPEKLFFIILKGKCLLYILVHPLFVLFFLENKINIKMDETALLLSFALMSECNRIMCKEKLMFNSHFVIHIYILM